MDKHHSDATILLYFCPPVSAHKCCDFSPANIMIQLSPTTSACEALSINELEQVAAVLQTTVSLNSKEAKRSLFAGNAESQMGNIS